jgi:hypothetical protein
MYKPNGIYANAKVLHFLFLFFNFKQSCGQNLWGAANDHFSFHASIIFVS